MRTKEHLNANCVGRVTTRPRKSFRDSQGFTVEWILTANCVSCNEPELYTYYLLMLYDTRINSYKSIYGNKIDLRL